MTYAPATLTALGAYWTAQGGVNLGIVGNTAHVKGYHLGKDRIYDGSGPGIGDADYSVKTARDRAGLTNAASAIDLGRLDGSLPKLRLFSVWLVARCRANAPATSDIREVIYSPDGVKVYGWSREAGVNSAPILGYGDASHLTHTHISWYRDAEKRDKVALISPYFEEDTVQAAITDETPCRMDVPLGAPLLELDGKAVLTKMASALVDRDSPYGVDGLRAMFATIAKVRRTVLVKPTAVRPIPATDCAPLVAAAVVTLQTKVTATQESIDEVIARLVAIKTAGGW